MSISRLTFLLPFLLLAGCASSVAPPTPTTTVRTARVQPAVASAYAALGASETYGVGAVPHTTGYAYLVARALRAHPFLDAGIPGTTLDAGYQIEVTQALAIRPALCSLFFGVNDLRAGVPLKAFLADLHDLVLTLQQGHCRVLIVGLPDVSLLPAVAHSGLSGLGAVVSAWNAGMAGVARSTGATFLNLASFSAQLAAHPGYVSPDGLHPSDAGHAALARVILAAIRRDGLWHPGG